MRFRLTTPRGSFAPGPPIAFGIPAGRAWGIESELLAATRSSRTLAVTISVRDSAIREAFVRVAWYSRATGRPRQREIADSALARSSDPLVVRVSLRPPTGAVAFRVRVLARLRRSETRSRADAVAVAFDARASGPARTRFCRNARDILATPATAAEVFAR